MKKKTTSVIRIVVAILMILVIVVALVTNIMFSRSDTPKFFGHYIYLMQTDEMELTSETTATADPAVATADKAADSAATASIHAKTAVIAKEYNGTDPISKNNPVLCKLADDDVTPGRDSEGIAVRRILEVEQDADTGIQKYYPTTMKPDIYGTESAITADSILGKCVYESSDLYSFVTFATGFKGILILLALPCVVLVIMLIIAIVHANARNKEDEMAFEETYDEIFNEDMYDEEYDDGELGTPTSLYQPVTDYNDTTSLQRKKSSIAQNFERKAVNPNSPYQKARTMQFKAQKDVPIYTAPQDQISAPDDNPRLSNTFSDNFANARQSTIRSQANDLLGSDSVSTYRGSHEASSSDEVRNLTVRSRTSKPLTETPQAPVQEPKKSATTKRAARYESASVDDLLAMIEKEKNKLN